VLKKFEEGKEGKAKQAVKKIRGKSFLLLIYDNSPWKHYQRFNNDGEN
jgi:hypothetical protein